MRHTVDESAESTPTLTPLTSVAVVCRSRPAKLREAGVCAFYSGSVSTTAHVVWNDELVNDAAAGGHFDAVKWLHEQVTPVSSYDKDRVMKAAVEHGNIEMAKWANELKQPSVEPDLTTVAKRGHVAVLEWATGSLGMQAGQACMNAAIGAGKLEVAKWLKQHADLQTIDVAHFARALHRSLCAAVVGV